MRPARFHIERPSTLAQALEVLAALPSGSAVLAGGQALVKQLRERSIAPAALLDISRVSELAFIRRTDSSLEIGALTTLADLIASASPGVPCVALTEAASKVGDAQIRARATVGGNLLAGGTSDLAVVLLACAAQATLVARTGTRNVTLAELAATACRSDELLHHVNFTLPRASAFEKLARRSADPAIVSAAACVHLDGRIVIAAGGVHAHAVTLPAVSDLLSAGERRRAQLSHALSAAIAPLNAPTTAHASAAYRRRVLPTIALRALSAALSADAQAGLT